jgi:hypothetical protein
MMLVKFISDLSSLNEGQRICPLSPKVEAEYPAHTARRITQSTYFSAESGVFIGQNADLLKRAGRG